MGVDVGVQEDVERGAWFDGVFVDVDAFEEGLVGDAPQGVVDAAVDGVHVRGQGEAVVQVGLGLVVLDLPGLQP
ncbi:MAG: hypothetical protein FWE61_10530 [Micrococcales bacterium]|nr:hypothetical protein [Micrococcales bacterium]